MELTINDLIAALVLKVGRESLHRPLTWLELGEIFGLGADAIRSRVSRFKKKHNIVDADIANDAYLENLEDLLKGVTTPPGACEVVDSNETIQVFVRFNGAGMAEIVSFEQVEGDEKEGQNFILTTSNNIFQSEDDIVDVVVTKPEAIAVTPVDFPVAKPQAKKPDFIITANTLVAVREGVPQLIDRSHKNYAKIEESLKAEEWQKVYDLIDMKAAIKTYTNGRIEVKDGKVYLDGEVIAGKVVGRILAEMEEGDDTSVTLNALANFIQKCDDNPDQRVVSRIYDFIKATNIRLDKDGDMYCYKSVRGTYKDKHSNTMDNSPGKTLRVKRNKVDPREEETCSFGLHVCSSSYLPNFFSKGSGDKVVLCKVNPADVVSIPRDYNDAKIRCCGYTVIKDCTENFADELGIQA